MMIETIEVCPLGVAVSAVGTILVGWFNNLSLGFILKMCLMQLYELN